MKRQYFLLYTFLTMLMLSSCDMIGQNNSASETQRDVTLKETLWKLIYFQDENGQISESGSSEITLIFHRDGTVSGTSSSNEYESSYSKHNSTLDIQVAGTTEVGEPDGSKYWDYYLPALKNVHSYRIHESELELYYGDNDQALIFKAIAMEE